MLKKTRISTSSFVLGFLLCLFYNITGLYGQGNSARLVILKGGNISFNFNTIANYKNGISILGGTILGVEITEDGPAPVIDGWKLAFNATTNQIYGEDGVTFLDLTAIQCLATISNDLNDPGNAVSMGVKDLGNVAIGPTIAAPPAAAATLMHSDATIIGNVPSDIVNDKISIEYRCGMGAVSMLGKTPNHYSVTIEFWLWPQCAGGECPF